MVKPFLLTVDDDAEVLRAVERDLRARYAERYRVLRADSGQTALEALRSLKKRDEPVALLLVDQRMPHITGVEFLGQAMELYPDAKRVLLTAYADTDASIRAINDAKIQHYLLKPWDPPEEHLYPVLDDLLEEWWASFRPTFDGARVLGTRWSPQSYAIREFLARNRVPYRWLDIETENPEVQRLKSALGADASRLPVVFFPDGSSLADPGLAALAEKLGLRTRAEMAFYDLVIIGGGPAGLAAAVYGASEGLHTVMIEKSAPGGQAGMSSRIENYLGFPAGLSGGDLAKRGVDQARRFGVEILAPQEATGVRVEGPSRIVKLADGSELGSKALLIATGLSYRKLEVPGAEQLQGRGRLHRGRRQLRRTGGDVLRQVRLPGGDAGAWRDAFHLHVAVPHRPDQADAQHPGGDPKPRRGGARQWTPGGDLHSLRAQRANRPGAGGRAICLHRCRAAH